VCAFERGLAEQNTIVGDDAHSHALNVRKTADQGGSETGFEFVERTAVNDAGDDFSNIKRLAGIGWNHTV
jgi:hypothetical protein